MRQKNEIRKLMLEERLDLPAHQVEELSLVIQTKFLKSIFWPKEGKVGLYAPVKNEVMTHKLFQNALENGLHVYFPRVEQGIQFYEVNGPEDLQRGSWSILEPQKNCTPLKALQELDLLVVPGISFSRDCYRIGYGRGFYDRLVSHIVLKATTIGLAYDFQIVDAFQVEDWDRPLALVMTEKNVIRRKTASQP